MKRVMWALALSALLVWTLLLNVYHLGVLPPPEVPASEHGEGRFISRVEAGLNHLILRGTPYTRGLKAGELTRELLDRQEEVLNSQLRQWIPQHWLMQLGIGFLIAYFHDADKYVEAGDLLEMYGTSKSAPARFNRMADPYTRQLAYHGLHEVGQMMVDRGVSMGCTVVAVPHAKGWILGRNFDFEGGRIFDEEKIVKWVYPEGGLNHVSVIWAGMVGAVTGVNEKGLYISINAAGSKGFRRVGTPSTLVLYKVLREAATVDDAIRILREARMFITDIFVVMDATGRLVKVEKSPQKFEVLEGERPFVVANHLEGRSFKADPVNLARMREQTTLARESRANMLATRIPAELDARSKTEKILAILRDKGADERGRPFPPGHRLAIDALIATHSVIYDSASGVLYVSQGPSVSGPLLGFDLKKSFEKGDPVATRRLPADPEITPEFHAQMTAARATLSQTARLYRNRECQKANDTIYTIPEAARQTPEFFHLLGDIQQCLNYPDRAQLAWERAYSMRPAYFSARRDLEGKLNQ